MLNPTKDKAFCSFKHYFFSLLKNKTLNSMLTLTKNIIFTLKATCPSTSAKPQEFTTWLFQPCSQKACSHWRKLSLKAKLPET